MNALHIGRQHPPKSLWLGPMLVGLAVALLPADARAQTTNRNFLPTTGNFNTGTNWSGGALPTGAAFIGNILPGQNQTATLDSSTNSLTSVYVGLNANGSATLNVSNNGSLSVLGLYLGSNSDAGGTVNQSGGAVTVRLNGEFRIVNVSTANSTYNLSGGTLDVNNANLVVGYSGVGVGTFNMSGGVVTGSATSLMTINGGSSLIDSGGTNSLGSITNNGSISFSNAGTMTRSLPISGTGAVTKSGAGQLNFSGSNSYGGGTTINAGSINMESANALGTGGLTMNRGGALLASFSGTLANSMALGATGSGDHAFLRNAAGTVLTGSITSSAASGSRLIVYSNLTGTTTFQGNTISMGSEKFYVWTPGATNKALSDAVVTTFDNVAFSTAADFEQAGSNVRVLAGTTMTIGGQLTSPGNWSQFTMNGGNVTVTGGIDFSPGAIAAAGMALNSGTLTTPFIYGTQWQVGTANELTTLFNGTRLVASADAADFLRVRLDGNTGNPYGAAARIGNGGLPLDTNGFNVTIANGLANATAATGSLTKEGAGLLTLTGSNTYSGATTVNAGGLLVDGAHAGAGLVSVANAARFGGDGSLAGGLTLLSGARFIFNPSATLDVTGAVALDDSFGVASLVNADGSSIDWGSIATGTYTLINTTSTFDNILNFSVANAAPIDAGRTAYFQNGSLQLVIVPEPGAVALAALGIGVAAWARRRRS
jgi:fibronectin-binding autotransporter adhesin